jgi:rubrerythrin
VTAALLEALQRARAAEKEQALFYRALAAQAEEVSDVDAVERLNGLHADEQHHLSRLSARLLELGQPLVDLGETPPPAAGGFQGWEAEARARERAEVRQYELLLGLAPDARTAAMLRDFLAVERRHESVLGGKWTQA